MKYAIKKSLSLKWMLLSTLAIIEPNFSSHGVHDAEEANYIIASWKGNHPSNPPFSKIGGVGEETVGKSSFSFLNWALLSFDMHNEKEENPIVSWKGTHSANPPFSKIEGLIKETEQQKELRMVHSQQNGLAVSTEKKETMGDGKQAQATKREDGSPILTSTLIHTPAP